MDHPRIALQLDLVAQAISIIRRPLICHKNVIIPVRIYRQRVPPVDLRVFFL